MEKHIDDAFKNEIKSLITKIKYLEISEAMKKPCDMDTDLVCECADFILEAENRQIFLTDEERKELVRKIPFKNTEKSSNNKIFDNSKIHIFNTKRIITASICIALILIILGIMGIAKNSSIFDSLKKYFGSVADMADGAEYNINGITVYKKEGSTVYPDIESAVKEEKTEILYPTVLPENTQTDYILFDDEHIDFVFNNNISYTVEFSKSSTADTVNTSEHDIINGFDCYCLELTDVSTVQIEFMYRGNLYSLSGKNKKDLEIIINNLEEYNGSYR